MAEISDTEREAVVRELTRHCGDGRLTLDELEERVGEAWTATTRAELRHALRELPSFRPQPAAPVRPVRRTDHPHVAAVRRSRPAPARHGCQGMVGGASAALLTLVTLLFVTAHYILAFVLLVLWLPRTMRRRAPVRA